MKKNYFLAILFSFAMISVSAQFTDDMESYVDGQPISGGHWTDWGCGGGVGCAIISTSAQAHGGILSGVIGGDGTTDAVLDLGNKIFGEWGLECYMYIPVDKTGYYNIQGTVPIGAGEWVIGNIFFNDGDNNVGPGNGYIDWSTADPLDDTHYTYPEGQWFGVILNVDISAGIGAATMQMYVDGVEIVPDGTPFADGIGTPPTSLGGLDLWSNSPDQEHYYDDFTYQDSFINPGGVEDFGSKGFSAYPNPVSDILNLKANEDISSVSISNILGQVVYSANVGSLSSTVDMSSYSSGTYFVTVQIGDTTGTIKVLR